jgi:UDP-glucose 4-epimerase
VSTILVTGGAGFIGASLVRTLIARGDEVRVLDDLSTGTAAYLPADVALQRGDVRQPEQVAAAAEGCDSIVHLAAHASVPGSIERPAFDFEQNVVGSFNVLEAARAASIERVVLASSNAIAGSGGPIASPDAPMRPVSPYGAAKATAEVYGHAFSAAYGMSVVALRFSNVYGPYSLHKSSVVAAFIRAAVGREPLLIYGDGEQTRDYIHVDDLVAGIIDGLEAAPSAATDGPFQLGTGVETSVNTLADTLEELVGAPLERRHLAERAGDVPRNVSDISRSRERLGFEPRIDLREGLLGTLDWWRSAIDEPAYAVVAARSASGSD